MNHSHSLESIPDEELLAGVQRLTARSNVALADLLAYLGEVEQRGIHRTRACASLYTYCIYELRMSEDTAFRRSKAARLVREYPELRDAIAKGEIHLTGVLMIGPHLGGDRHAEIIQRARFRSKRELLRLVAELDPRPEVPTLVEPIGPERAGAATHRAQVEALAGPVRELQPGRRPEDWMEDAAENSDDVATSSEQPETPEPERPLRYGVQFTASQDFVDLLNEACDLLSHENPQPSIPDVQLRAMRALVKQLQARKRGATDRPRSVSPVREGESNGHARVPSATDAAPARFSPVADGAATPASRYVPAAGPARRVGSRPRALRLSR